MIREGDGPQTFIHILNDCEVLEKARPNFCGRFNLKPKKIRSSKRVLILLIGSAEALQH